MNARFERLLAVKRPLTPAVIAAGGALLTIVILLANQPGLAITVASLILPVCAIVELSRRDLFEEEPAWGRLAILGWGVAVGIIAGLLATAIAAEWWIDGATLNVGAAGFGGQAAKLAGTPGFGVLLLNGIVLPALAVAVSTLGPVALHRYPVFRNEVMDGVTLGVAAGCGLSTGMTIVFIWPIASGSSIRGDSVADWTALLTGILVTRPIIFGLVVGFLCSGIWHSSISQRSVDLFLPAGIGLGSAIFFSFVDLLIQPRGTRWELLWHGVVAVGLIVAGKVLIGRVIAQDRMTQAIEQNRVICPNCGSATPAGTYCARCGASLNPVTIEDAAATSPITPEIIESDPGPMTDPETMSAG